MKYLGDTTDPKSIVTREDITLAVKVVSEEDFDAAMEAIFENERLGKEEGA